jgi:NAD(P)-dependent dehydrogenase (short-subunit alcohol dehydrogenase family)
MIIITGASKGIGKYLLERYLENGKEIVGIYNSTKPEAHLLEYCFKADITKPSEINSFINAISKRMSHVVLINCAGANYNSFAHKTDITKWAKVIEINLIGTFQMIHAILPTMREQGYGRIINFSSIVAQDGVAGTSSYAASKSGLWGLAKSIAAENGPKGITINNLNLGYFDIGMISEVPSKIQQEIKQKIPSRKFGNPTNIYNAVDYLIKTEYMNGASLDINGGLH